jgi:hypothetical protein
VASSQWVEVQDDRSAGVLALELRDGPLLSRSRQRLDFNPSMSCSWISNLAVGAIIYRVVVMTLATPELTSSIFSEGATTTFPTFGAFQQFCASAGSFAVEVQ